MTSFADNLKNLRKTLGLTQFNMAIKAGISPQMISQYELGKTQPNSATLRKLSDTFGVNIDSLIN